MKKCNEFRDRSQKHLYYLGHFPLLLPGNSSTTSPISRYHLHSSCYSFRRHADICPHLPILVPNSYDLAAKLLLFVASRNERPRAFRYYEQTQKGHEQGSLPFVPSLRSFVAKVVGSHARRDLARCSRFDEPKKSPGFREG